MEKKYYERKVKLVCKPIPKDITVDPQGFFDNRGWNFLDLGIRNKEPPFTALDLCLVCECSCRNR